MSINETTLLYDATFVAFLDDMHREFKYDLPKLGMYEHTKVIYPLMHNFIKKHIARLNHSTPYRFRSHFKPNCFAIFVALCSKYREYSDWDDFKGNIIDAEKVSDDDYWEHAESADVQCCCSHTIKHVFYIVLADTHNRLVVGETCVCKQVISNELREKLKRQYKESVSSQKKHKEYAKCITCGNWGHKKEEAMWKPECIPCWKKSVTQKTQHLK